MPKNIRLLVTSFVFVAIVIVVVGVSLILQPGQSQLGYALIIGGALIGTAAFISGLNDAYDLVGRLWISGHDVQLLSNKAPEQLRRLSERNLKSFSERGGQLDPQLHPKRAIQDELESFLQGQDNGCILLIGKGGTGKSSIIYHLAKWAIKSQLPILYLDAGQQQIYGNWLATELDCKADDLPNFPDRYQQQFGEFPIILIDTVDQLISSEGIDHNVKPYFVRWSESTRMICACRSGQAEELKNSIPSAKMREVPRLTRAEIKLILYNKIGMQFMVDEPVMEIISIPLFLYLWLETGTPSFDEFHSLWSKYWSEIINGRLANPQDWENFTRDEFGSTKSELLNWMAQQMFQRGFYYLLSQDVPGQLSSEHNYYVAYDALIRAGTVFKYDISGITRVQFFHQSFFEFVVSKRIIDKERSKAEREIDQLVRRIAEPYCQHIISELAYLAHQQDRSLEDYLYKEIIAQLGDVKMEMRKAQEEKRPFLPLASAISWGTDEILQDLVDLWGPRLCATLDEGSSTRKTDGEIASTIGSIFERNPRPFAVPSLIVSMHKYEKRGRFRFNGNTGGTPRYGYAVE